MKAFCLAVACAVPGAAESSASEADREPQPNILFIAVDDLNDWIGCLGGYPGTVHTPHLDQLAGRGVLFSNAHCPSPKCAPCRAAVLCGLYPSSTGLYDNGHWWRPHRPDLRTLPAHFKAQGYRTVGAGKIHHHTAGFNPPDQWDQFEPLLFHIDPWFRGDKRNYPWSQSSANPAGFPFSGVPKLGHENDWGALPIPDEAHDDHRTIDAALAMLRETHDQPFFLACGLFRPHLPWYVPQQFLDLYSLEEIVLPEVPDDDLEDLPAPALKLAADRRQDFERIRRADKWRHAVRAYLASISYADHQVGRLLDALQPSPHAANTIVVLWSDHGWHLGEKQHWHKSTLWERATRVPLIIAGPGIAVGRCDRPVNLIDLYPTLTQLAGLPPPSHSLDGLSLLPLLRDPQAARTRPSVIEFQAGNAAVRTMHHRYIRYHDGSEELYDHRHDPQEWANLAAQPETTILKAELARWLPKTWAEPAPGKGQYNFDLDAYTWTAKPKPGDSNRSVASENN